MREKYESLALVDLKAIARTRGIKGTSLMKKGEVVDAMLELDAKENAVRENTNAEPAETPKVSVDKAVAEMTEEGEKLCSNQRQDTSRKGLPSAYRQSWRLRSGSL